MPKHPNSLANLQSNEHPVGQKIKTKNGYWRVKVPKDYPYTHTSHWAYVHHKVVETSMERRLRPNERVYFKTKTPAILRDPSPDDLEVRIIAIQSGKPPGKRKYWARRVIEDRRRLQESEARLAEINVFYGRKPDDVSDAFETREWNGA